MDSRERLLRSSYLSGNSRIRSLNSFFFFFFEWAVCNWLTDRRRRCSPGSDKETWGWCSEGWCQALQGSVKAGKTYCKTSSSPVCPYLKVRESLPTANLESSFVPWLSHSPGICSLGCNSMLFNKLWFWTLHIQGTLRGSTGLEDTLQALLYGLNAHGLIQHSQQHFKAGLSSFPFYGKRMKWGTNVPSQVVTTPLL